MASSSFGSSGSSGSTVTMADTVASSSTPRPAPPASSSSFVFKSSRYTPSLNSSPRNVNMQSKRPRLSERQMSMHKRNAHSIDTQNNVISLGSRSGGEDRADSVLGEEWYTLPSSSSSPSSSTISSNVSRRGSVVRIHFKDPMSFGSPTSTMSSGSKFSSPEYAASYAASSSSRSSSIASSPVLGPSSRPSSLSRRSGASTLGHGSNSGLSLTEVMDAASSGPGRSNQIAAGGTGPGPPCSPIHEFAEPIIKKCHSKESLSSKSSRSSKCSKHSLSLDTKHVNDSSITVFCQTSKKIPEDEEQATTPGVEDLNKSISKVGIWARNVEAAN